MYEIKANGKHTSLGMLLTAQKLINKALLKKKRKDPSKNAFVPNLDSFQQWRFRGET